LDESVGAGELLTAAIGSLWSRSLSL